MKRALSFLGLMMLAFPAHTDAWIVMKINTPGGETQPTYLALWEGYRPRRTFHQVLGNQFRHRKINPPLTVLRIRSGTLRLSHLDYAKRPHIRGKTRFLGNRFSFEITAKQVHYLGDLTLSDQITHAWNSDTIREFCSERPDLIQSHRFVIPAIADRDEVPLDDYCNQE